MTIVIPFLSAVVALVCITGCWRRSSPLEALPTTVWLFLSVVPFAYLARYFPPEAATQQAVGIALIALALAAGDLLATRRVLDERPVPQHFQRWLVLLLSLFVVALPIIHLLYAHDIPVLHLLRGEFDISHPGMVRENFAKLLDAPEALKILFNWVIVVVGPVLAAYLFTTKRWLWFVAALLWCAVYATLSAARLPILLFVGATLIAVIGVSLTRLSKPFAGFVIVFLLVANIAAIYRGEALMTAYRSANPSLFANAEFVTAADAAALPVTPGDVERIRVDGFGQPVTFGPLDSSLYRAFLGPVEVANRWYAFFPKASDGWRPLSDLLPVARAAGWLHASNRVAMWAYVARFPLNYLESAHAYASADADSFAFGGLLGCVVAALGLFLLRLALAWLRAPGQLNGVFYFVALTLLCTLPFQASLQAILVPNGMVFLLLGLLVTRLRFQIRTRTDVWHVE